jgi:hypothetical protein
LYWPDDDPIDGLKHVGYVILFKYTKVVFDGDIKVLLYVPHLHNGMDPLNYILILIIAFISTMSTAATCHVLVTINKKAIQNDWANRRMP